jgi:hypothetical protein
MHIALRLITPVTKHELQQNATRLHMTRHMTALIATLRYSPSRSSSITRIGRR